jgi:hypothetical protein
VALYMTNQTSSQIFTDIGGHVPVRSDVTSSDPLITEFALASAQGEPRPQIPEFNNYWDPFYTNLTDILNDVVTPKIGVMQACANMNELNEFPSVSGSLGVNGVNASVGYTGGETTALDGGNYQFYVVSGWTGSITPIKAYVSFAPLKINIISPVTTDLFGQDFVTSNKAPTLISISPNNKWAGRPGVKVTVFGSKFVENSVVRWNGSDRVTTYVNSGKLTVQITSADIATAGTASITVFNPAPGGGTSASQTFTIKNEVPAVNSLSPASRLHGKPGFTLTVFGARFGTGAVVRWNGSDRPTTFVNSGKLTVLISAADIATAGIASVRVFNPAPFGGLSNAKNFTIQ